MKEDSVAVLKKRIEVLEWRLDNHKKAVASIKKQNDKLSLKYANLLIDYKNIKKKYDKLKNGDMFEWMKYD